MTHPPDGVDGRAAQLAAVEHEIRELAATKGASAAATAAVASYGPELLGYLFALAPSGDVAQELFSELCERLWRALPQFRWESSFRTWAYTIARNLAREHYRRGRRAHHVALSEVPEVALQVQAVRSTTMAHLRTASKQRLEALRAALDPDERTLLVLRVDRRMAWRDIARVMAEGDVDADDLVKLAAKLRKRFERVKERLRAELLPEA